MANDAVSKLNGLLVDKRPMKVSRWHHSNDLLLILLGGTCR